MSIKKMLPVKPPSILIEFLELCRLMPPSPHFPDTQRYLEKQTIKLYDGHTPRAEFEDLMGKAHVIPITSYNHAWEKIIEYSKKSGYEPLVIRILEGSIKIPNPNDLDDVFIHTNYFRDFIQHHRTIRSLAENWAVILSGEFPNGYEKIAYYNNGKETVIERFNLPFDIYIQPAFTMDGRLEYFTDPFDKALSEVDSRRLRICPICDYVFWAHQSNQKWCSAKCKRTGSKRKTLANPEERARVNKRRRENYQRNKKLNELKDKNNGAL